MNHEEKMPPDLEHVSVLIEECNRYLNEKKIFHNLKNIIYWYFYYDSIGD